MLRIASCSMFTQGAETSCVCVCTKRMCVSDNKSKACTVGIYSTYKSRYLYSLGSWRLHLFIVNCLLKNKFNIHAVYFFIYLSQHYKAKFSCKEYNLIKVNNKLLVIQA